MCRLHWHYQRLHIHKHTFHRTSRARRQRQTKGTNAPRAIRRKRYTLNQRSCQLLKMFNIISLKSFHLVFSIFLGFQMHCLVAQLQLLRFLGGYRNFFFFVLTRQNIGSIPRCCLYFDSFSICNQHSWSLIRFSTFIPFANSTAAPSLCATLSCMLSTDSIAFEQIYVLFINNSVYVNFTSLPEHYI